MKKFIILFFIGVAFYTFGFTPYSTVIAHAVDYSIEQYTINADLQSDGGVEVTEFLTYDFDSSANGVFRNIDFVNPDNTRSSASGIDSIKVYEAGLNDDTLTEYANGTAENGQKGIYETSKTKNGVQIKIYCPADNERKRFLIQYHLSDATVKYSDTADFYWRFIGDGWESSLHNVSIVVTAPAESDHLRIFSHGPLNGTNHMIDKQTVQYENNKVGEGKEVTLRVLFPSQLLASCKKTFPGEKLSAILTEEKQWALEANQKRKNSVVSGLLSAAWFLVSVFVYVYLYNKYGKREKAKVKIWSTPPADYGPAFTEYINSYSTIGPKGITAEIMELARKKYIFIDDASDKPVLKGGKPDLAVSTNPMHPEYSYEHEKFLIDWFINKIGDGRTVTLNQIQIYSKKHSVEFNKTFEEFKNLIKNETIQMNLVSKRTSAWKPALLFFLFSAGTGLILAVTAQMYAFGACAPLFALFVLLLSLFIKKPTRELAAEKEKWQAYRAHLRELSRLTPDSSSNNYDLRYWEHALVYAIVFGHHKSILKRLQRDFSDMDFLDPSLTYLHSNHGGMSVLGHFSSTVDSSITNFSSTSGFNGGSSSGGSGGGGGGGGAF